MEERFIVIYHIIGDKSTALEKAKVICLEQTVEVGDELVLDGFIRDQVIGELEDFFAITNGIYEAHISYAIDTTAYELTQLLNIIFGNTSIKAGIRVHRLNLGAGILSQFSGPRFGIAGLRKIVNVYDKPLLCTALKPMGKSAILLAEFAYQFALNGVDVIKDDHGLTNQPFCPFEERVKACVEAVATANQKTGKHCIYVPNITAPTTDIMGRVYFAKKEGVGGLLIAPGLTGFDTMRSLSENNEINLPLISHPAFLGSMVTNPNNGFSHAALFGQLQRLAGADASIFPNYGGRFGFSKKECQSIAESCKEKMGHYFPMFPTPGGGMSLENIPDMLTLYGNDVIFLIGGALYSRSADLGDNVRYFLSLVGRDTLRDTRQCVST
ncbi:RuBisCO large subunit C-terminal-like domain-containing protein [Candidatus Parabeggiatoa sp. HSG14]|uniref:RuBisCO large subunit C-terminal-like domain-containing protein n=1 Tax=Candidatus Parabeggiatoa sp. HSG14 TaxID=3055593 RepID=UPI0025A826CA|nr:RuBisCO large subunit C-terminal-like domain-containing protein [Thiotrichales bacterium HSG14]